jgi:hypothetical protein
LEVLLRHRAAAPLEELAQICNEVIVTNEAASDCGGNRLTGDVVGSRTQTARQNDNVRSAQSRADCPRHASQVVADDGVVEDIDADSRQLTGDLLGVAVGDLTEQKLRTYADDLGVQRTTSPIKSAPSLPVISTGA